MYGQSMAENDAQKCPYCKKLAHMEYVEDSARYVDDDDLRVEAAYQCTACRRFIIGGATHVGLSPTYDPQHPWHTSRMIRTDSSPRELYMALAGHEQYWEPVSPVGKEYENVPAEISGPASEAYRCLSIGANRAAILMARAVIEATAKAHNITTGGLMGKINEMGTKGVIRPLLVEAAHEIRYLGNDMAHGDFATADLTQEDADEALELMDDVLTEAFVLPRRVERRRERRTSPDALNTDRESTTGDPVGA